jgi:capsular polysaccharide export protein
MTGAGAGPGGRAGTPVWMVGRPAPGWAALLPGFGLAPSPTLRDARFLLASGAAPRRLRGPRSLLHMQPGPLQMPRFLADPPWLSATLGCGRSARVNPVHADPAHGDSPHPMLPGSAERALLAGQDDPATLRRAADGAAAMVRHRVGGAAWADPPGAAVLARPGLGLVVLQGAGNAGRDRAMLAAALARHDAARIVVAYAAPAVAAQAAAAGCRVLPPGAFDPWPLVELADEVHVAGDGELGLLGLLAGCAVHAHAPAWFAGWGATEDGPDVPPRAGTRSPAQIAAAGLLGGASYRDPFTGESTTFEAALDIASEWRRLCDANRGIAGCVGMQFWKRRRIGAFLHTGTRPPPQGDAALAAARATGGAIAAWASRMPDGLREAGIPVLRVEDGFLRSVGLGSDFLPPCSIIVDGAGIYYDPSRPSDLEAILAETGFDRALLDRATSLVERLVNAGVTKYNTGAAPLPALPAGQRVVLVPGQVADDLSVRLGGGAIQSNLALLQAVRAAAPDAHILYKPHPDVDAGHRQGAIPDIQTLEIADQIVRGVPMAALIGAVQEVHTLTSLAGFEALLRGRRVTCWGQPFYAGWGLTQDMAPVPRRTRKLSLPELAAGVLLLYPRYLDPLTGLPCPAEVLLDRLADPALWRAGPLVRLRRAQGQALGAAARWMTRIAAARTAAGRTKP